MRIVTLSSIALAVGLLAGCTAASQQASTQVVETKAFTSAEPPSALSFALASDGSIAAPERSTIAYIDLTSGRAAGTANQHEPRSGLSLIKLYIAEDACGRNADDCAAAQAMLRNSDDGIAESLWAKYPDSIERTVAKYGLEDTYPGGPWGFTWTSSADVATFVAAKLQAGQDDPVIQALEHAEPIAADGYPQDWGTARIPGVLGTKWAWADDASTMNASVSFGPDYAIAISTYGDIDAVNEDLDTVLQ